jgi:P-type Cu+ transporter
MSMATDPVCGMKVETATAQLTYEHEGSVYYFCGRGCMLEFRDDPRKYLAPDYRPEGMPGHGAMPGR